MPRLTERVTATDPRVLAVAARMRTWDCFEPLRPDAYEELAREVVAVIDAFGQVSEASDV